MAYHVRFGEQYLGDGLFLLLSTEVQPLEGTIDVCKGKKTIRIPIVQSLGCRLMRNDPRDE